MSSEPCPKSWRNNEDYSLTSLGVFVQWFIHPVWSFRAWFFTLATVPHVLRIEAREIFDIRATVGPKELEATLRKIIASKGFDSHPSVVHRILGTVDYEVVQLRWRWKFLAKFLPSNWIIL